VKTHNRLFRSRCRISGLVQEAHQSLRVHGLFVPWTNRTLLDYSYHCIVRALFFVSLATWYELSSDGTDSPRSESSTVRKVQGRYERSMVRIVHEGTNGLRYESFKVRIVQDVSAKSYDVTYHLKIFV